MPAAMSRGRPFPDRAANPSGGGEADEVVLAAERMRQKVGFLCQDGSLRPQSYHALTPVVRGAKVGSLNP